MINIVKVFLYEYKKIFKDYGALLILIFAPIFYSFFYPLPYEKEVIKKVPVAVVDYDKTDLSRKIIRMLDATEFISVSTKYPSLNDAKNAFYNREINGIIYIPIDFYKNVVRGVSPKVTLFSDGSYMLFYSETFSSAMKVILTTSAGVKIHRMNMQGVSTKDAINIQSSVTPIQNHLFNPASGYGIFVIPGVFALILQQIILVAMMLVQGRDYEEKTTFIKSSSLIDNFIGKTLTYLSFFYVIAFYFFQVSIKFYGVPSFEIDNQLLLFLLPYSLSVVFLGLSLSFFAKEREGGIFFIIMTSIPLLFLAGFAWPVSEMPLIIQWLRLIFPSSSGVLGLVEVRQLGATVGNISFEYINLWILTIVYMVLSLISLRYRMVKEKD